MYALFRVKFWPQKLRSCKSFDKYHVWLKKEKVPFYQINISLLANFGWLLPENRSYPELSSGYGEFMIPLSWVRPSPKNGVYIGVAKKKCRFEGGGGHTLFGLSASFLSHLRCFYSNPQHFCVCLKLCHEKSSGRTIFPLVLPLLHVPASSLIKIITSLRGFFFC